MDHVKKSISILRDAQSEFGDRAFATSSFQTQGIPFLHLISKHARGLPVFFIDTGFHFAETLYFKYECRSLFDLEVIAIHSDSILRRKSGEEKLWRENSALCCDRLKVHVMDAILRGQRGGCWISGVRHDQTKAREGLLERESAPHGITRVHPMLHWTSQQVNEYIDEHNLPRHPLWEKGYSSIGCWPCTNQGSGRQGRWEGQSKEGCGIHHLLERKPCED